MGLLSWFKKWAGVGGVREAMVSSYAKHVRQVASGQLPLAPDTTPHQAGLYGALSTRYMAHGQRVPEVMLWTELTPFMHITSETLAVAALVEYVVWKEERTRHEANVSFLVEHVRAGLSNARRAGRGVVIDAAEEMGVPWIHLG